MTLGAKPANFWAAYQVHAIMQSTQRKAANESSSSFGSLRGSSCPPKYASNMSAKNCHKDRDMRCPDWGHPVALPSLSLQCVGIPGYLFALHTEICLHRDGFILSTWCQRSWTSISAGANWFYELVALSLQRREATLSAVWSWGSSDPSQSIDFTGKSLATALEEESGIVVWYIYIYIYYLYIYIL